MFVAFITNLLPTAERLMPNLKQELHSTEGINDSVMDFARKMLMVLTYLMSVVPDESLVKDVLEKLKLVRLPQLDLKRKNTQDSNSDSECDAVPKSKIPKKSKIPITSLISELNESIKPHECELDTVKIKKNLERTR